MSSTSTNQPSPSGASASNDPVPVHIIVNPVSGQGKGPAFVKTYVEPILTHYAIPYIVHHTTAPDHAGEIARTIHSSLRIGPGSNQQEERATVTVLIVGGDGTAHELIEGLSPSLQEGEGGGRLGKWELVLFPFGTANALFNSLFSPSSDPPSTSLLTFLHLPPSEEVSRQLSSLLVYLDRSHTSPLSLPITLTSLVPPDADAARPRGTKTTTTVTSHVVLSTCLHAHILHTSDQLRASHPGTERFRLAAQVNAARSFDAEVRLLPLSTHSGHPNDYKAEKDSSVGAGVKQWHPASQTYVAPFTTDSTVNEDEDGSVRLQGPFGYFLTTSTVDRLEPTFVISPHSSLRRPAPAPDIPEHSSGSDPSFSSTGGRQHEIYVLILRPMRDARVRASPPEKRGETWSKRAFEILMRAYGPGEHVDLTFPAESEAVSQNAEDKGNAISRGEGEVIVELFKCGSVEWVPAVSRDTAEERAEEKGEGEGEGDGGANLVCADGSLHTIPPGGRARISLAETGEDDGFFVWA